ncbi:hypothetical protein [Lacipirellula parvula]|uniref:Peptidase S8/S53 domain-containing protein n=1 Tax=Lacipirellula parvula TaxID=2650471 RepID=A0A5K7X1Q0_9BACT|nr:hypothetical protein [Lacipirellula parvula]BBO30574.1 hypothetical protein PLANPX_0186 [Lacipirellula parvula]
MRHWHSTERTWRLISGTLLALLVIPAVSAVAVETPWGNSLGYTKLQQRLGAAMPIGAGGTISLVEASPSNGSGSYLVDVSGPEFNGSLDPSGAPVVLTDGSSAAHTGFSSHATWTVGQYFFGNTQSFAPGADSVVNYDANAWLSSTLRVAGTAPPDAQPYRVQNFSWVSADSASSPPGAQELAALRRLDYLIETGETTAVVGANNAISFTALRAHPALFAHSYNAIVVGRTDGGHSRGQTSSFYGPGRYRPDVVAPSTATSSATALISSMAAMLHETAAGTDAARSEVMRAIIMAGATKTEFANWLDQTSGVINPWNHTQTRPLDDVFGAGEANVYNSYSIQIGGKQSASAAAPAAAVKPYGWDYQDRKSDAAVGDLYYNFEVAAGSTASELSIMLNWNAKITDTNADPNIFTPVQSLQNLDLQFYDSSNSFMGTMIDQSISTVDNVEHIYLTNLGPGTYTLKVSGAANWDYGLAWRMATSFNSPNADFNADGVVDGADFLVWQRNSTMLVNATNSQGDADGDGDVDADDLELLKNLFGTTTAPPMAVSMVAAVPEPAAVALAAAGVASLGMMTRLTANRRK